MRIEVGNINVENILFSGSCFRAVKEEDGSITNILSDRVINIKQDGKYIFVESSNYDNLESVIREYFDLNRDYDSINKYIIKNNPSLKNIVNECYDYRILNQDSFEMCISYIISQNNNVKRISNSIQKLCESRGKKIKFNNKEYYLFPKYEELKGINEEKLREFGVGFRDKYIIDFLNNYYLLDDLDKLNTEDALSVLMKIKGIGLKVASCILLFGYKRLDVFPIDTWVKHYFSNNFNISEDQKDIKMYALNHFGKYSGLVIQYMFHYERNL